MSHDDGKTIRDVKFAEYGNPGVSSRIQAACDQCGPTDLERMADTGLAAESPVLQEVTETPAAPYFVQHPTIEGAAAGTVVFIASGSTTRGGAQRT